MAGGQTELIIEEGMAVIQVERTGLKDMSDAEIRYSLMNDVLGIRKLLDYGRQE